MGRKSDYTEETAELICHRIANGESLRAICEDEALPSRRTVERWLIERPDFVARYVRAREAQADVMDEKILAVADACTNETAQADRVKIMAYQWRASKLAPKKYGDRLELAGGVAVKHDVTEMTDDDLARIASGGGLGAAATPARPH